MSRIDEEKIAILIAEDKYKDSFYGEYVTEQDRKHHRQLAHQILEALADGELGEQQIAEIIHEYFTEKEAVSYVRKEHIEWLCKRVAHAQTIRLNAQHALDNEQGIK